MPTEFVQIDGKRIETLSELLRPGLKAVFVGLNPSPVSVAAGHYFQGRLGRRFWSRLQQFGIAHDLRRGFEDVDAFSQGFGFADLVRRPTARADHLTDGEMRSGASDLARRLNALEDRPLVVFVFKKAADYAGSVLESSGFKTVRMPGPYASSQDSETAMNRIAGLISS